MIRITDRDVIRHQKHNKIDDIHTKCLYSHLREAFKNVLAELGGTPPPLTENQSEKKKVFFLRGKGGYPPPLTESPLSFSGKIFPKRAKNDVFFIK